jgi:hypothetical protein
MIKKMVLSGLCGMMSVTAFAAYPSDYFGLPEVVTSGFYINGQLGWGRQELGSGSFGPVVNDSLGIVITTPSIKESGIAGRLAFGYDFNNFFGLELGGSAWERSNFNWTTVDGNNVSGAFGSGDHANYAVDLLGKIDIGLYRGLHVFVKGGGAYVFNNIDLNHQSLINDSVFLTALDKNINDRNNYFALEAAAGIGYQIDPHWDISLNYMRIFGNSDNVFSGNYKPKLSMTTLGVEWDI